MDLKDFYLDKRRLIFVVIDMQEALVDAMKAGVVREVIKNIQLLIQVAKTFQISIIFTEQYPKGLRKTVPPIRELLGCLEPVEKVTFSCLKEKAFTEKISDDSLNQAVIMGMETHVCVFQTVLDLLSRGYTVHVPRDATCSRVKGNWVAGLSLMEQAGALITSAETIAFQLLEKAGTDAFRALAPLLK